MGASSERKLVRKLLPHGIAVVALVGAFAAARPQSRPNIVFVLSDDQAHDTLSIAAHRPVMTPNLDRLAREGVWFRQAAVVTPLCAPSRAAFLTGLYGHTSGFRTNNGPWPEKFPPSFLSVAHEAGYRTAFIGKKHIYNTDEPLPGIDRWVSFVNQGWFVNPDMNVDGRRSTLTGANGDLLTDFAAEFIRANRDRPFALVVAYKEAHSQQTAPDRFNSLYAGERMLLPATFAEDKSSKPAFFKAPVTYPNTGYAEPANNQPPPGMTPEQVAEKKLKNYYRCVTALDDYVGRIRKALEETGVLDRTIFAYAGDNGYFLADHGRFEKMTPHEESVRVPFLMRYPPAIRASTVSDELVLNIDLAPTLYDLARLRFPRPLDGRSMRPIFEGLGTTKDWRQEVYHEWQGTQGAVAAGTPGYLPASTPAGRGGGRAGAQPAVSPAGAMPPIPTWRALRTRTHKYAVYFNGDLTELYDLAADPKETRNLAVDPSRKALVDEMHGRLLGLAEKIRDPLRSMIPTRPSLERVEPQ